MDFTFELSKIYSVLPFEILKQDKDEVIMLINYMSEKADAAADDKAAASKTAQDTRIHVNDKTATGGWW